MMLELFFAARESWIKTNKQTKILVDMHFVVLSNFSSLDPQNICVAAFQFHVKRKSISNLKSGLILLKTKRPAAETKVTPNMKEWELVIVVFELEAG